MRYRKKKSGKTDNPEPKQNGSQANASSVALKESLEDNLGQIRKTLGNSSDVIIREIKLAARDGEQRAGILYTDGLADQKIVSDFILEPLLKDTKVKDDDVPGTEFPSRVMQVVKNCAIPVGGIRSIADFESLYLALLSGDTIILVDGEAKGIAASTRGWKGREVGEPASETVVRGPREAFTENIRTNTALLRRKIKDPSLWLHTMQIGQRTRTDIGIMFIQGIANDKIVEEVRKRLDRIDVDGILESGYIEEMIEDASSSPFPTVYNSERPDVIAAELLEGKIAILVDGTPFVLIVPALFMSFLHSAEDYYQRTDISNLIRILRYVGLFISLLAPSLYIAITTFHQELLPTALLINLAAQREGVPFPAFIEALMMEITFEILREAGIRMPKYIGSAISIVGTLVIGQAAVEAGIVSSAMVIVVAITAISNFVLPAFNMSIAFRMLRFPLMVLAASFGLFGLVIGIITLVLHMCSLRSFGVPYMSPFAPFIPSDQKDAIFRLPHWLLKTRPRLISQNDITRRTATPPRKSRN